ncbi:unnamed protein product, partial [Ectocarpus sp. 6 AP-2014]
HCSSIATTNNLGEIGVPTRRLGSNKPSIGLPAWSSFVILQGHRGENLSRGPLRDIYRTAHAPLREESGRVSAKLSAILFFKYKKRFRHTGLSKIHTNVQAEFSSSAGRQDKRPEQPPTLNAATEHRRQATK